MFSDNFLFIVENENKRESLKVVLENIAVFADFIVTNGSLLEVKDSQDLPVTLNNFGEDLRVFRNGSESIANLIKDKSNYYEYIIIATDPNETGDLIAFDISNLIEVKSKLLRCKIYGIDNYNVDLAMHCSVQFEEFEVFPSITRRIFNSLVDQSYPSNYSYSKIIKIAKLLQYIKSKENKIGKATFYLNCNDHGQPFVGNLDLTKENYAEVERMHKDSVNLPGCDIFMRTVELAAVPWSFSDCIVNLFNKLGGSYLAISNEMQLLYENGKLSYPKSKERSLTLNSSKEMREIAISNGMPVIDYDREDQLIGYFNEKNIPVMNAEYSCESLRPSTLDVDVTTPIKLLNNSDSILSLITRNLLMSGINVNVDYPNIENIGEFYRGIIWKRISANSLPWKDKIQENGVFLYDIRSFIINSISDTKFIFDEDIFEITDYIVENKLINNDFNLSISALKLINQIPSDLIQLDLDVEINRLYSDYGFKYPSAIFYDLLKLTSLDTQTKIKNNLD